MERLASRQSPKTGRSASRFWSPIFLYRHVRDCLYREFLQPKLADEDTRRREFILNVFLIGTLTLTIIATSIISINALRLGDQYRGVPPTMLMGVLIFFGGLYAISRSGHPYIAAFIFLALYYLLATYSLATWGILLPQGLLIYALLITMSGILISTRSSVITTCVIALSLIFITEAQTSGRLTPDLYWTDELSGLDDILVYIATFGIILAATWLGNHELERSLERARRSEAALKAERDLLEVKVEERTQALRQSQLEQMTQLYRFAELGRLASGILHDIANPLTTVSLNLEQLSNKDKSHVVKRAIAGTQTMERFIQSAWKQVQQRTHISDFVVEDEIKQAMQVLQHKAKRTGVTILFKPIKRHMLHGDPIKFCQLTSNLISNAIDSYDGITQSEKHVTITVTRESQGLSITIHDRGVGIAPADIPRVFTAFYTTKPAEKGTGLGLSFCKDIIEKDFGGTINVHSTPKDGTTFTVMIPQPNDHSSAA